MSDIDIAAADGLKVLDLKRPIREADVRSTPRADIRRDRATRLLDVGLDFCCERSVAGGAGGAAAAP